MKFPAHTLKLYLQCSMVYLYLQSIAAFVYVKGIMNQCALYMLPCGERGFARSKLDKLPIGGDRGVPCENFSRKICSSQCKTSSTLLLLTEADGTVTVAAARDDDVLCGAAAVMELAGENDGSWNDNVSIVKHEVLDLSKSKLLLRLEVEWGTLI